MYWAVRGGHVAERVVSSAMVVAGLAAWLVPVDTGGQPWYLGPALFPRLVGLVLAAGGTWELARGRGSEGGHGVTRGAALRVCVLTLGLVAAPWLVDRVGLPVTAAILSVVGGLLLGLSAAKTGVVGVVVGLLAWGVFGQLLGVGR